MGGGWRRVFCTRDPESTVDKQHQSQSSTPSPRSCVRQGFLSNAEEAPQPTSPRSPSFKLSLFRNSFKFRSNCGICLNGMKTGQGSAIYTAECGHAFHFPCIAVHVSNLACPVCNATWKDVPAVAHQNDVVAETETETEKKHSDLVRLYDDDEPLPSPFSGIRIAPIPEADEENDDEENQNDELFRGFIVNPRPPPVNDADSRRVRVKLMPECAIISASQSHKTYALVLRVMAPPPPPRNAAGPPVDLVAVVDVGGGITGAKLHMLKLAMRLLISSLSSADRLAVVASSASSKRLMPLRRMTAQGQSVARRVVDSIASGNGTTPAAAVDEAFRKAAKVLEDRRERNPVACLVLFSKGQDEKSEKIQRSNSNKQRQRFSFGHVSSSRFNFIEIPVHSFGFGNKTGFVSEPADDYLAKHIEGILSVVVQDLRFQLGVSVPDEISAVYSCNGRPRALGLGAFRIGDLYAEDERELLVELRVPTSALGTQHVMNVRCIYKDPVKRKIVCGWEHALPLELRLGGRAERLRNVFITSRAIAESGRLVEKNDFSSAYCFVASARELLAGCGSGSAVEYLRSLDAELAEIRRRKEQQGRVRLADENGGGEELTPTSAWRAAERLAKMAMMKKSLNRVSDLYGFEDARF